MFVNRIVSAVAVSLALTLAASPRAEAKSAMTVSFLSGKAEASAGEGGAKRALKMGDAVAQGETIETGDESKLELSLPDGSKLRFAPKTKVTLSQGKFGDNKERNVSASIWVGRIWAKVAKAVGGGDSFEVETRNAVAGVRGTSFTVAASADLSAVVRVYAGTVGVRKSENAFAGKAKERKQIKGPERIDKKQWEEIIATAMKQVKITALGDIAPAEDFEDSGEDQKWAMWNKERDEKEAVR